MNNNNHECTLTTFDNPYDPFDQFVQWRLFDLEQHYNTCELIARFVQFSDDMTQHEMDLENERAIDEIIKYDFANIYKKIYRNPDNNNSTD